MAFLIPTFFRVRQDRATALGKFADFWGTHQNDELGGQGNLGTKKTTLQAGCWMLDDASLENRSRTKNRKNDVK